MTGQRRLADDGLPHARRPALLRRHLLPPARRPRHAGLPPGPRRRRRAWRNRRDEVERQADELADAIGRRIRLPERPGAPGATATPIAGRAAPALLAAAMAELGARASTPTGAASARPPSSPSRSSSSCACATTASPATPTLAGHGRPPPSTPWPPAASTTTWAAASPATRPTPPGWCRTSRRCSTTRPCWCAPTSRLAGHRRGALAPGGRGDDRLRAARPAPPEGGLVLGRGRRLRGRGGPVLRLDAAEIAERARARARRRRRSTGTASPRRATSRAAPSCAARSARRCPARRGRSRPGAVLFDGTRAAGPARARRQGPHRVERHVRLGPGRGRRRPPGGRLGRRRRCGIGEFLWPTCAGRRRALAALVAGRRGPGTWPTPPTTPGSSTASPGWPSPPARPAGSSQRTETAARHARALRRRQAGCSSPPGSTPRRS